MHRTFCVVKDCYTNSRTPGMKLHAPPKNAETRRIWCYLLGLPQSKKFFSTCSAHFEGSKRYYLVNNIPIRLPTLKLPNREERLRGFYSGKVPNDEEVAELENRLGIFVDRNGKVTFNCPPSIDMITSNKTESQKECGEVEKSDILHFNAVNKKVRLINRGDYTNKDVEDRLNEMNLVVAEIENMEHEISGYDEQTILKKLNTPECVNVATQTYLETNQRIEGKPGERAEKIKFIIVKKYVKDEQSVVPAERTDNFTERKTLWNNHDFFTSKDFTSIIKFLFIQGFSERDVTNVLGTFVAPNIISHHFSLFKQCLKNANDRSLLKTLLDKL